MLKTFKAHFTLDEAKSVCKSFISFGLWLVLMADTLPQFQALLNGDWSKPTLLAAGGALARSAFKLLWAMAVQTAKNNFTLPKS